MMGMVLFVILMLISLAGYGVIVALSVAPLTPGLSVTSLEHATTEAVVKSVR